MLNLPGKLINLLAGCYWFINLISCYLISPFAAKMLEKEYIISWELQSWLHYFANLYTYTTNNTMNVQVLLNSRESHHTGRQTEHKVTHKEQ